MAGAELRRSPKPESLLGNRLTVLLSGAAAGFGEGFVLTIVVVPDSGTEGLSGLSGNMTITITEGKHFYELEYTLPEEP